MAFSTDLIKEDTFSQLISLTQKYEVIYLTYEQTVLNLFFKEWKRLPIVFNTLDYVLLNILGMGVFKQGVETIVLHLVDGKTYFTSPYPEDLVCKEWRENLEKSELIALDKFVPPKKTWTKKEINKLDLKYKKLYKIWKKAAHNGWRKRSFKTTKAKYILRKLYSKLRHGLPTLKLFP
jgi:lipopolysaccharide biosynthesis glycosyltransferase